MSRDLDTMGRDLDVTRRELKGDVVASSRVTPHAADCG